MGTRPLEERGGDGGEVELFTYHGPLCLHRSLVDTRKSAYLRCCRCVSLSSVKGIALMLSNHSTDSSSFHFYISVAGSKRLVESSTVDWAVTLCKHQLRI